MHIKTFSFLLIAAFLIQPMSHAFPLQKSKAMSKKEIALKVAKITGYSAELVISTFFYIGVLLNEDGTYPVSFINIKECCINKDFTMVAFCLVAQTPFLASIGHALYGLGTELRPLAKNAMKKIREHSS